MRDLPENYIGTLPAKNGSCDVWMSMSHSLLNISFRKHQQWIPGVLKPYPVRNYMESPSLGAII
jgi:hypothetical protein